MKLYGSTTSPFVRHCRIACLQENLPFELVITDYAGSAAKSPTKRVPFLEDDGQFLTDSLAILHYVRGKNGNRFLATVAETELFCIATTALEAAINVFLLERDGLTDSPYIQRQKDRVGSCFEAMEQLVAGAPVTMNDAQIRIGVLCYWLGFRKRFDFSAYKAVTHLATALNESPYFLETLPPEGGMDMFRTPVAQIRQ